MWRTDGRAIAYSTLNIYATCSHGLIIIITLVAIFTLCRVQISLLTNLFITTHTADKTAHLCETAFQRSTHRLRLVFIVTAVIFIAWIYHRSHIHIDPPTPRGHICDVVKSKRKSSNNWPLIAALYSSRWPLFSHDQISWTSRHFKWLLMEYRPLQE